jgi:hypothetical protein
MKSQFRRLSRSTRGSVLVELVASVFILLSFFVGISYYTALSVDARREGRSIRSALEMVLQLDVETSAPTQGDADGVAEAAKLSLKATDDDSIEYVFSVAQTDAMGTPEIGWTRAFGNYVDANSSRISVDAGGLRVGGVVHDLRPGERIAIVELFRNGRGIGSQRGQEIYKSGIAYRRDVPPGP